MMPFSLWPVQPETEVSMTAPSPFAPDRFPDLPAVAGVRLAVTAAGIRYRGRPEMLLVDLAAGSSVAGVFTRSQTAAAPVLWCRSALEGGAARGLLVNAGNANAFTGRQGEADVAASAAAAAAVLDCTPRQVFVSSTGVIGVPLPMPMLTGALPALQQRLGLDGWEQAAAAIATTDTFRKGAGATTTVDGRAVHIVGIAKGAGMIAPDMATMLAFIFTDAAIAPPALQALLNAAVAGTFNCITIDGDTSTNDTLLLFATGAAGGPVISDAADVRLADFAAALETVCRDLAQQIVKDGEGATKFVTISVSGASDGGAARHIALTVANSPLVKTAIAGEDANWGRIVMAVGRAGERIDRDHLAISIGGVLVTRDGGVVAGYDEAPVAAHMRGREIAIAIDVGVGQGEATVWTCDLGHGYIDVNASYRS
jgi:glutamate N-acetyltransferase/amino-acid N-acetyltransferase